LVLNRIVEYPSLAGLPVTRLRAYPKSATRGYHERHVANKTRIGDARVRRYARARLQHREERGRGLSGDVGERRRREQRRGARTARQMTVGAHTVLEQVISAPLIGAVERT